MGNSSSVVPNEGPTPSDSIASVTSQAAAAAATARSNPRGQSNQTGSSSSSQQPRRRNNQEDVRDKYVLGEVLGSGSFGQVIEVRLKDYPNKVRACKVIERGEEDEEDEWSVSALFRREVSLLQTMNHRNIVRFWDFHADKHFLYVVMDLCRGGEIFDMVLALKRFTEADAAILGAQMLSAIDYIHKMSIMHRDIKAENFLLAEKSPTATVKMIDFGMAVKFNPGEEFHELCGSPHYLAPELIGQRYGHLVDIWAFGVMIYLMMYGHYPFDADHTKAIMVKVIAGTIRWVTKVRLSDRTVKFLKRVLAPKATKRINAEVALQDEWITSAGSPDAEPNRELSEQNLHEVVRSAHRKMTSSRQQVNPAISASRTAKLQEIAKDFEKGIRHGERLGDTPNEEFMSKPEFVRRANRLVTAPGLQIRATVKTLAASAQAKMSALRKGNGSISGSSSKMKFASVMSATPQDQQQPSEQLQLQPSGSFTAAGVFTGSAPPKPSSEDGPAQAKSMKGGLMYIGKLHPEEIKILKNTWEEWRQQQDGERSISGSVELPNTQSLSGSVDLSEASVRKRVSTEECVLTVQAQMERAVAERSKEPVTELLPSIPSMRKQEDQELEVAIDDLPLPVAPINDVPLPLPVALPPRNCAPPIILPQHPQQVFTSCPSHGGITPSEQVERAAAMGSGQSSSGRKEQVVAQGAGQCSSGRKPSTGSKKPKPKPESLIQVLPPK